MRYSVGMADRVGREDQADGAVKERVREKAKEPTLYSVVLLNDDYTPMQFVDDVLETVFQKSPAEAYRIMMQVHLNGRGVAGIYPWEVAETKVDTLVSLARAAGHPLQATIEDA
jgi:ATP-dependent Clp protease adaptor protein ClpS